MATTFPYSYFRCPCADQKTVDATPGAALADGEENDEDQETFDPKAPRSNFSLYPLDHLMWCEDCHDIRCPRCTLEEVVCWFCPSCLFEVASSMVKSEGNRCTRNCFNCPICTAPLSVNTINLEGGATPTGPWILACEYCNWTTLDIGVQFEKPTNIHGQLAKIQAIRSGRLQSRRTLELDESDDTPPTQDIDARFSMLRAFYSSQITKTNSLNPLMSPSGELNYNSPSSLARIMSLYTGTGNYGKKTSTKASMMHESADPTEGLRETDPEIEAATITKLRTVGWEGTFNSDQRFEQTHDPRFIDDLRPVPTLLQTKRSKRCNTCRHILVKPEAKISSTRYRIKLIALSYVPAMTLKHLPSAKVPTLDLNTLPPFKPLQFLLTVNNPMFDPVKVTLATPSQTPGRFQSRVTVLCPQFEVGANTDVWDEALSGSDGKKYSKQSRSSVRDSQAEGRVAEAGKVWEKGRNWTVVVVEVVCARIEGGVDELAEDEDVLEIPVFVRIEYEADVAGDVAAGGGSAEKDKREKRELAYWAVLGVGKIARSGGSSRQSIAKA